MNNLNINWRRWLPIVAVVVLALIGWQTYYSLFTFHITGTDPKLSSMSVQSPYLKVNFSQSLSSSGLSIQASDKSVMLDSKISGKQLTVDLANLNLNASYTVTITHIQSTKGKAINNLILKFTAKDVSFNQLPKDQQNTILQRQDQSQVFRNDPIFNYTPHSTLDYNLTSLTTTDTNGNPKVVLKAELLLSAADQSNPNPVISQYKQEVVDYIKSVGLDPASYQIDYTVSAPGN